MSGRRGEASTSLVRRAASSGGTGDGRDDAFVALSEGHSGFVPHEPLVSELPRMAANFLVEVVLVGPRLRYSSLAGAGFITGPIASTSCDHRSRSRDSWAFPAAVSR
jgi:hypothetical protein